MGANSKQSAVIYDAVCHLDHPTADHVFAAARRHLPKVSLGTVYRNLQRLVAEGEIVCHPTRTQARYEANLEPHVHLHDLETDRLVDVPMTKELEHALQAIATTHMDGESQWTIEVRGRVRPHPQ